jgi:hypothetical protein
MKIKLSEIEKWAEFDRIEPKKEGEISAAEYGALIGCNQEKARIILRAHVKAGTWKSRKTTINGKSGDVFWPVTNPDDRR